MIIKRQIRQSKGRFCNLLHLTYRIALGREEVRVGGGEVGWIEGGMVSLLEVGACEV